MFFLQLLGNKKNVEHFVKYLSWVDDNGKTQVNLLDIDGSLSTTTACAKAIEFSMEKIAVNGEALVLNGQTTDSGGGGVLDKLAEELSKLKL